VRPRRITAAATAVLAAAALALAGCGLLPGGGETGDLAVTGRGAEPVQLAGAFETAVYSFHEANAITVVLIEGDPAAPTQAVTLRGPSWPCTPPSSPSPWCPSPAGPGR